MNKIYKIALFCLTVLGGVLFILGHQLVGFVLSVICIFDFGRRLGFDQGFFIGYCRGKQNSG